MDSFDLDLDINFNTDRLSLSRPSDDLTSLFLNDGIDSIDEQWWQALTLPCSALEEKSSASLFAAVIDSDAATAAAPSSSCSSPTPTFNSDPDVDVGLSESGAKRSASSSPECEQDDPKRARRLEKNREAASQSRARKKSYVKELEVKCRMLEAHVAQLQRVMTVTSMENSALKDELVRVKIPKDGVKSGVAEPAVLESNSLPSEFLRHRSFHCPMVQQATSRTAAHFQKFLLAMLQLAMLAALNGSSGPQTSPPQPLSEGGSSVPMRMEFYLALQSAMGEGRNPRRKKSRHQYDSNFRWSSRSSERNASVRKRRKVKHLRSSRLF